MIDPPCPPDLQGVLMALGLVVGESWLVHNGRQNAFASFVSRVCECKYLFDKHITWIAAS